METAPSLSSRSLQYYVMARHWASELEFFKVETAFFHRLLDDYIVYLTSANYAEKLKISGNQLLKLEADERQLDELLTGQIRQLELMAEDVIPEDAESLATMQIKLERLTTDLMKAYQAAKKQLFVLVESAMRKKQTLL